MNFKSFKNDFVGVMTERSELQFVVFDNDEFWFHELFNPDPHFSFQNSYYVFSNLNSIY